MVFPAIRLLLATCLALPRLIPIIHLTAILHGHITRLHSRHTPPPLLIQPKDFPQSPRHTLHIPHYLPSLLRPLTPILLPFHLTQDPTRHTSLIILLRTQMKALAVNHSMTAIAINVTGTGPTTRVGIETETEIETGGETEIEIGTAVEAQNISAKARHNGTEAHPRPPRPPQRVPRLCQSYCLQAFPPVNLVARPMRASR